MKADIFTTRAHLEELDEGGRVILKWIIER
jgi:hypothetical protein